MFEHQSASASVKGGVTCVTECPDDIFLCKHREAPLLILVWIYREILCGHRRCKIEQCILVSQSYTAAKIVLAHLVFCDKLAYGLVRDHGRLSVEFQRKEPVWSHLPFTM